MASFKSLGNPVLPNCWCLLLQNNSTQDWKDNRLQMYIKVPKVLILLLLINNNTGHMLLILDWNVNI